MYLASEWYKPFADRPLPSVTHSFARILKHYPSFIGTPTGCSAVMARIYFPKELEGTVLRAFIPVPELHTLGHVGKR
jgi:hypothetical protein